MDISGFNINGLDPEQVIASRSKQGSNITSYKKQNGFSDTLKSLLSEPMLILLFIASTIYFVSGKTGDGIFLSSAIILVSAISIFQNRRSRNALDKLKELTRPLCKVIRNTSEELIKTEELVIGDVIIVEEGTSIPADAELLHATDFTVNESILTGESLTVSKNLKTSDTLIYQGTTVATGMAVARVTAIGNNTKLGRIGKSLETIEEEKTPLEIQINGFVKKMVIVGAIVFVTVWIINFYNSHNCLDSLLKALTLAMSILPEEIPVAFATFMALGAWRLMKLGVVVKQMKTVETLGSATVICTDKTGTLTENKMSLARVYSLKENKTVDTSLELNSEINEVIRLAMWASEPIPFDPMELALHEAYKKMATTDERPHFKLTHEYPLEGKPPMMTHVFKNDKGEQVVAAKGAPEAIIAVSGLTPEQKTQLEQVVKNLADDGYRVLGVGEAQLEGKDYPLNQHNIAFTFKGLVAFYDPPKKNISNVLSDFYSAGIQVKIITGDNAATTSAIAKQVGFIGYEKSISGEDLMKLSEPELRREVTNKQLFTRMFPEAKLKIINALKANREIVAMTGDGVNDGPALKAAHIGIAMGKKGTEIAKQAASLILVDDDLANMVDAVATGRKIYTNLKKAIQYIISIHIPIILVVFIPLALGWIYPNIFSPIHIIFLELIMGPTCSILYENEPIEKNTMLQKPRPFALSFFNYHELLTSLAQGLAITLAALVTYLYCVKAGNSENLTRTMVFMVLINANLFLTLVNRSFYYSVLTTLKYRNNLLPIIIGITITLSLLILYIPALRMLFQFEAISYLQLFSCVGVGFVSVMWYEIVKCVKRFKTKEEEVL